MSSPGSIPCPPRCRARPTPPPRAYLVPFFVLFTLVMVAPIGYAVWTSLFLRSGPPASASEVPRASSSASATTPTHWATRPCAPPSSTSSAMWRSTSR